MHLVELQEEEISTGEVRDIYIICHYFDFATYHSSELPYQ